MENNTVEYIDYHPIGSVIIVRGNIRKLMVVARGVMTRIEGEVCFFDYGAVLYPDGLVTDKLIYFNHKDISKVVHEGFSDEDERMMKDNINTWLAESKLKRGNPFDLNMKNMRKNGNL